MKRVSGLGDLTHLFRPGTRVVVHSACAAPPRLCAQLLDVAAAHGPFELFDLSTIGNSAYVPGVLDGTLRLTTFVPGRAVRPALRSGAVSVVRQPLSAAPARFADGTLRADILLLHLSAPGPDGRMTLGIACDTMRAALAGSSVVIAELNPDMPRTRGATAVAEGRIDYWIEGGGTPSTIAPPGGDATDQTIADHVAGLIRSGDVLQTGIGSIPDLTLARLTHLRGLGIHTGVLTEGARPLIEAGAVETSSAAGREGALVATMAAGTEHFYRFLHDNPAIDFRPCDETHDTTRLARISGLCAINGALEVDLAGGVNSESVDGRPVSGPGGQPDFARGATLAPGGRSIVALRATSKDGSTSRIVPALSPGAPRTIGIEDVDYVVTEYGAARVRDRRGGDLARALAAVAAPGFRRELARGG